MNRSLAAGGKQTYFKITQRRVALDQSVNLVKSVLGILFLIYFLAKGFPFIPDLDRLHAYCT